MDYTFHPLAEEYPLLEGDEFRALVESIDRDGQTMPIYIWRAQVIDGRNRYRACQELGIGCKTVDVSGLDESELPDLIERLNLHRRHLSAEWRQQRAAKLRAEGKSYRAIAEELHVSHQTICNDLRAGVKSLTPDEGDERAAADDPGLSAAGVNNPAPDEGSDGPAADDPGVGENPPLTKPAAPRTVTGRDGKAYAAKTAKPKAPKEKITDLFKRGRGGLGTAVRSVHEIRKIQGHSQEVEHAYNSVEEAMRAMTALGKSLGVKSCG